SATTSQGPRSSRSWACSRRARPRTTISPRPARPDGLVRRLALAAAALLAGAPAARLAWLVGRYGVDVPYHDQWPGELPLFEKLAAGRLGFADLWEPHNEHRIF